jgi:tRNA (cmo5U34)-methyltransferase
MKDELYNNRKEILDDFAFNENTANIFNDMLKRSVPHYYEIQDMICEISKIFAQKNSNIYDLGCSTGNTLLNISKGLSKFPVTLIGIDNSEAMLKKAEARLKKLGFSHKYELLNKDLNNKIGFENAGVIISNLTLQFIRPINRDRLLTEIYKGLNKNGIFILVEKIVAENSTMRRMFIKLYHDFKLQKRYSRTEIARKREALENFLIPYMYEENVRLLKKKGFQIIDEFFRWYNFCGILAIK